MPIGPNKTAKKSIKLCALVLYPYDTAPGQRFRIEQWEPFLNGKGITIDYYSFADPKLIATMPRAGNFVGKVFGLVSASFRRFTQLLQLSKYDAIYLYRAAAMVGPAFFERIIKLIGKPVIYDFDDAIFLTHTATTNRLFGWAKFAGKTASLCRISDAVTVGNSFLAKYAEQFSKNVSIVPSSVDTTKYVPPAQAGVRKKTIVGWTGSSTSQTYLEHFNPMLEKVFAGSNNVELHVHSDREPNLPGTPFVWHPWSPDNEVETISNFDIGLMPMPDDNWSKGKCAMKALLYMSLGIPAICSDIGANREVITHGKNGLLCTSNEEWIVAINSLIEDSVLRKELGDEGRRTVEEKYSAEHCASLFADAVFSMLERKELKNEN